MNVCKGRTSKTESAMLRCLHIQFRSKNSITIQTRSIMGTEIPHVKYMPDAGKPTYSFSTTRESIDKAREAFRKVKDLTVKLSMVRKCGVPPWTEIYKKTQKEGQMHCRISRFRCIHHLYIRSRMLWKEKERRSNLPV